MEGNQIVSSLKQQTNGLSKNRYSQHPLDGGSEAIDALAVPAILQRPKQKPLTSAIDPHANLLAKCNRRKDTAQVPRYERGWQP